ncbi:MAG: hypothetical protein HYV63_31420 [Candidatus Schekmanbacteria bacterium]|nr:hypothetical protein [Candidatus Schekmanbacteria bacterium]
MRKKAFVFIAGVATLAYMNRKELAHYAVGAMARAEQGVRDFVDQVARAGAAAWSKPSTGPDDSSAADAAGDDRGPEQCA